MITRIPEGIIGYRYPMVDSHAVEAVVLCYDSIHGFLSKEERNFIIDCVYEKVYGYTDYILRTRGSGYLLTSNQGPIYFLGFLYSAILVRNKYPVVEYALERNLKWFEKMMSRYFREDGSINEGIN
jgi:hypothetical protein